MRGLNPFHPQERKTSNRCAAEARTYKKEKIGSKPQITRMDVPKRSAVRCRKNSSGTKMLMPETVCDWPPICGILTRSISGLRFQFRISGLIDGSWHIDPKPEPTVTYTRVV
jgi:hypothetical protein